MKPLIIQLLEAKGIPVPEKDYKELSELYEAIQLQKQMIDWSLLEERDIALKTIAGGDYIDE